MKWRRREVALILIGVFALLLGCGQVITLPTPTPPPATADVHLNAVTPRATSTPAPATPSPTLSPTPTPTPIIYVVQQGDTLSGIAKQFGIAVEALMDANEVYDARRLQIGQTLIIPREEEEQSPPTPTPTPLPVVIENLSFHETPVGSLWCLGEVRNLAGMDVEYVQVQVSLYDSANVVLATATAFTALDIIPAGETSPFAVLFARPPTSYATYQVIPLSAEPSTYLGSRYRDLTVVEHEGQSQGRLFIVSGRVRNIGEERATGVEVVITAYDSQDRVVAVREVEVQTSVLAPGASEAFTASISPMGDETARYIVQVQGQRIG